MANAVIMLGAATAVNHAVVMLSMQVLVVYPSCPRRYWKRKEERKHEQKHEQKREATTGITTTGMKFVLHAQDDTQDTKHTTYHT